MKNKQCYTFSTSAVLYRWIVWCWRSKRPKTFRQDLWKTFARAWPLIPHDELAAGLPDQSSTCISSSSSPVLFHLWAGGTTNRNEKQFTLSPSALRSSQDEVIYDSATLFLHFQKRHFYIEAFVCFYKRKQCRFVNSLYVNYDAQGLIRSHYSPVCCSTSPPKERSREDVVNSALLDAFYMYSISYKWMLMWL